MAKRRQRQDAGAARNKIKFEHRLVLANWMLDLFGAASVSGPLSVACSRSGWPDAFVTDKQGELTDA